MSASRGFLATGLPFLVLSAAGLQAHAIFTLLGGLNTAIADTGGEYRSRLLGMSLVLLVMPVVLFCGMQVHGPWWQALILCLVSVLGGFARALGATGTAIGLVGAIAFLIGIQLAAPPSEAIVLVGFYAAGSAWAIAISLFLWLLRPYRRIRQEVASCLEATAHLLEVSSRRRAGGPRDRDRDRAVAADHQRVREAIEQARSAIGELQTAGANDKVIADLIVILRAASRISSLGISLREIRLAALEGTVNEAALAWLDDSLSAVARDCRTMARDLLGGRPIPIEGRLPELSEGTQSAYVVQMAAVPPRMMSHLHDAQEALDRLTNSRARGPHLLPTRRPGQLIRAAATTLRAHLTTRSLILRHALRVGVATGAGIILAERLNFPHPIWIPLTTLVVLQPNFGGTLNRGIRRTIGTIAGAALASSLLLVLPEPWGTTVSIAALCFITFLFMPRRYATGVTFLTALIIVMLSSVSPGAWTNVVGRVLDTLIGSGIALIVGFALWPIWDRHQMAEQLARALRRLQDYADALLALLVTGEPPAGRNLHELKRQVEIETANTDAMFQRTRMEPQTARPERFRHFAIMTQIQRLNRHLTALGSTLELDTGPHPAFAVFAQYVPGTLAELATEMDQDAVQADAAIAAPKLPDDQRDSLLTRLLARIMNDLDALRAAGR